MTTPIFAAIMATIASTDISEVGTGYTGRAATFQANHRSSLFQAAKNEDPNLRIPLLHYCACRWDFRSLKNQVDANTKTEVKQTLYNDYIVEVTNKTTGKKINVRPVDWGPARWTGRIIDLDSLSMRELGLKTDDEVEIVLRKRK